MLQPESLRIRLPYTCHGAVTLAGVTLICGALWSAAGMRTLAQPAPPGGLVQRSGEGSVILHWHPNAESNLKGYHVYRAEDPEGPFSEPLPAALRANHFVDFDVENDVVYYYRVRAVNDDDQLSDDSEVATARPRELDDEAFLDLVQQTAMDFFWYEANPKNGLIRDRSRESSPCSIASVGFGLSALTVGVNRGWLSREAVRDRVLTTLEFFWASPQGPQVDATGHHGFYYHFLDMNTGRRSGQSELSTIDTALLLAGVLHVGEFFDGDTPGEARIRALADSLLDRVNWTWMQPHSDRIVMGWKPETGFLSAEWRGYNEAMILYLLALGSNTHPVSGIAWQLWVGSYSWETHYGYSFVQFPPLFGHQYSHVWVDFRGIEDPFMRRQGSDYFENSRRATLAQRAYAIANPAGWSDYGANVWGLTASDTPDGYRARGAPPPQNDDGTVAPTGPGGSYAFTPTASLAALRYMYDTYRERIWWRYGFRDAFNPTENWFATDHIGIDQGPIVLMIENGRSGSIWEVAMKNEHIKRGLDAAAFEQVQTELGDQEMPSGSVRLEAYPQPAFERVNVVFRQPRGRATLDLLDIQGRHVKTLYETQTSSSYRKLTFGTRDLSAGVYLLRLTGHAVVETIPVIVTH